MRWDEQAQRWAVWNPQAQRWEWTTLVAAAPQQVMYAGPSVSVTRQKEPMSHTAHLLLTVFTCGLWLPFWIGAKILHDLDRGRKVKTTYR